ncbi:MAG: hypothetical protein FWF10_00665 [Clostridiales bacterium]|nr:hypothetical protein [Clostridiales bacterium]
MLITGEIIALTLSALAVLFSIITFVRTNKKDTKSDGAHSATIIAKIDFVSTKIGEMQDTLKEIEGRERRDADRLTAAETKIRSIFFRLNALDKKGEA